METKKSLTSILDELMEYLSNKSDIKQIKIEGVKTNIIIKREEKQDE